MITKHWKLCICTVVLITVFFILTADSGSSQDFTSSTPPPSSQQRLTILTGLQEDVYLPIIKEFENRTGIWVEVVTGDLLNTLSQIGSDADYSYDLLLGCHENSAKAYSKLFQASKSNQLLQPFSFDKMVIIYNSKLISIKPPKSWKNLLEPTWKGRIIMLCPNSTDIGYSSMIALAEAFPGKEKAVSDAFADVLQNQTMTSLDKVIQSVAIGNYCISIVPEYAALRAVADGHDIKIIYPAEGSISIPNTVAIFKQSTHTENAQKFIDFLLDEQVQDYLADNLYLHSVYDQEVI